jgi:large subunit ribosomal protein L23
MSNQRVLVRPYVTEKTTRLMEEGQYTFIVGMKASKPEIRQAVEKHYPGADVDDVRTMIIPGKKRSQFTQDGLIQGSTSAYKKAIVTLKEGSAEIDFFESI